MRILTGGSSQTVAESEQQENLLEVALKVVKNEAFEMKRALDRNELMDGLKHAAQMLCELRTSLLTPKFYYRLYIDVTNELQHFLVYLSGRYLGDERKYTVAELYETVQYTGNIIPRLYLLVTVGIVYIKSKESPAKDILNDLVEMCRGVQHPLRGLFLRNYLLTQSKELIPDNPIPTQSEKLQSDDTIFERERDDSKYKGPGTIQDAIDFIMTNFAEMNKLWVRMQHQGPSREKEKREKERRELRILVGTNLVRLSQLQNLDLDIYRRFVLPGILEQSVSCKEPISQEYLMECVIQVFPDQFHLSTLNEFLEACAELHSDVKIKNILGTLIEHLALYAVAEESPGIPDNIHLFEVFLEHADKMIGTRTQMPPEEIASIQIALLNLALTCYRDKPEFADSVFLTTVRVFDNLKIKPIALNSIVGRELNKLLRVPIEHYNNMIELLKLNSYGNLFRMLDQRGQRQISSAIIQNAIDTYTLIESEENLEKIFALIDSLLIDSLDDELQKQRIATINGRHDHDAELNVTIEDQEEFEEEQNLIARLVHLIRSEDIETHFKLLSKIRKIFGSGGKARLRFTLPPTIFVTHKFALKLAEHKNQIENFDARVGKIFHFSMNTINALRQQAEKPELALRFLLQGALVSDKIDFDKTAEVTYEFISKAFSIYEEEISESREQVQALTLLIATITQVCRLTDESHEPLRNQCALYASKLLKRPDQAQMICLVARVFWYSKLSDLNGRSKSDGTRVLECIRKATKIASQCMEELVQCGLYLHILSTQLHFFEEKCLQISRESIEEMILKLRNSLLQMEPQQEIDQLNENLEILSRRFNQLCQQHEHGIEKIM